MPQKSSSPRILQLLQYLTKPQIKEFELFLDSPYFVRGTRVPLASLFKAILPFAKQGNWDDWETKAWKKWQNGEAFDLNYFRKSCVKLGKFFFQFLAQDAYMKEEPEQYLFLLTSLNNLQAMEIFPVKFEEAQKVLQNQLQDYDTFRISSQVAIHGISHQHLKPKRQHNSMLDQAIYTFNQSYFIQRLKFALEQINQTQIISDEAQSDLLDVEVLLRLIEIDFEKQHDLVKAYYYLTKANLNLLEPSFFQQLKTILRDRLENVSSTEMLDIYGGSINYCIRQTREKRNEFESEISQLYTWMMEKNILSASEGIVGWHIHNMVLYYINQGQLQKVEDLITWCEAHLYKTHRERTLLYVQAILHYVKSELKEAKKTFVKLLSMKDDVFFGINARTLLARVYYEQEDYDLLENHISSSMQYIRTQKIPKGHKQIRYNFFRLLRKLYQTHPAHTGKLNKLEKEIEAISPTNSQRWLLQKLAYKRIRF